MRWLTPLHTAVFLALAARPAAPAPVACPDLDGDRVCDRVDPCAGDNATGDRDGDHVCDDRDVCRGDDRSGDTDGDRVCDDRDRCAGDDAVGDRDRDAVCDDRDLCLGQDSSGDADADGLCGDRDPCLGASNTDADADEVCDEQDLCWGVDRYGDADGDGLCSGRDPCFGFSNLDADHDTVCDELDVCRGVDGSGDYDNDGWCDDLDVCPTIPGDGLDLDGDWVCDPYDRCFGTNTTLDWDQDGVCGDLDLCLGDDATEDADSDAVCDDHDACAPGEVDADGDGRCGLADACLGTDSTGDGDNDGVCDDIDPCDDRVVAPGTACVVPDPIPVNACRGAPSMVLGRNTGFVTCPDGSINRLFATDGWLLPDTEDPANYTLYYGLEHHCTADADCTARPNGACVAFSTGYGSVQRCSWGCGADADCAQGEICLPPNAGLSEYSEGARPFVAGSPKFGRGVCMPASCADGADCASGECGYGWQLGDCGEGTHRMTCRDPALDSCRVSADCPYDHVNVVHCDGSVGFGCAYSSLASQSCGRPLLDDQGEARLPALPADLCGAARVWARIGAMEAASIASFARHALELMTLGAPADLLVAVVQAQADEVVHASLAFAVAEAAGQHVSRGPLPLDGVSVRADVVAILDALVLEGCVGETVAAAEAAAAATLATVPQARHALEVIAADEARHAALAWRTVAWLLQRHPHLAGRVHTAIDEALAAGPGPGDAEGLRAWGVVDSALRREVFADVTRLVIRPAAELLGPRSLRAAA